MRRAIFLLLFLLILMPLSADTSGILKTRLFEKENGTLILEVDVPAIQEGSLGTAVFPARYRLAERSRRESLDLLTLRFTALSYGEGFSSKDVLELPWAVNGISLTVFRSDGTLSRSLHKRELTGISIPLARVLPEKKSPREELRTWLLRLLRARSFILPLFLLSLVIGALFPLEKLPVLWFVYFVSAAVALPVAEAGLRAPLLLFSMILNLFLVLFLSIRYLSRDREFSFAEPATMLGITGFITGLCSYGEYNAYALSAGETAGYYVLTLLILIAAALFISFSISLIQRLAGDAPLLRNVFVYLSAVTAVFLILFLFSSQVRTGETGVLGDDTRLRGESLDGAAIELSQNSGTVLAYPDAGLSLFIAMDPYELRLETLVHLSALIPEGASLSPAEQPAFLDRIESELLGDLSLKFDGLETVPISTETSFVQILNNGISLRSEAVPERADEGLIGITLVYGCDERIKSLSLNWDFFPGNIEDMPVRMAAPWEDRAYVLSLEERDLNWKSISSNELRPSVIPVAGLKLPVFSIVLFLVCISLLVFGRGKGTVFIPFLLVLALLIYPRPRITVPGPLQLSAGSDENMVLILDGLLGNLYRSFELRDDDMVYDRLALSVEGEFLQEVFLQNRRAMVLEERGGARAMVEDVTLISSDFKGRSEEGGILINAEWTVSGAVSHFGHTHYRRNRYQGDISLVRSDSSWKISDISLRGEEREL